MTDRRRPRVCAHCHLAGHDRVACHVRAQRRRWADDADMLAARVSHAAINTDLPGLRRELAIEIRRLIAREVDIALERAQEGAA